MHETHIGGRQIARFQGPAQPQQEAKRRQLLWDWWVDRILEDRGERDLTPPLELMELEGHG